MQEPTRESLQQYFNADYKGIDSFIDTILKPIFGEDDIMHKEGNLCDEDDIRAAAAKANIISIQYVAQIRAVGLDVNVFDVTLSDHCRIQHARKGIQSLVRQFVQPYGGAFLIFHYQNPTDRSWRLSYLEKRSTNNDSTSAKRFTYLCGHNFACRTLAERLLILKDSNFTAADFEKAFSVEALSEDFFKEYKVMYDDIVQYITGQRFLKKGDKWICTPEHVQSSARGCQIYQAFAELYNDDEQKTLKAIRDYVKKLLGRLVFIQFVQKKGWLKIDGIPSYNFLLELFQKVSETSQDNFIDRVLEEVVYMLLNTDHSKCGEIDNVTIDVPFLNGGLFEQDEFDKVQVQLPKEFFHNAKYAEVKRTNNAGQLRQEDTFFLQCGILDLFNQYNFTIDENDPNDAEVGVDPEMLGKIFENLLEDNKEKGAFYTPKEIVNYMCQESLIAYLNTEVPGIEPSLRAWVKDCVCDEIINAHKAELQQALEDVKICDPAIGSGAFPMGLLNLLVRLQTDDESGSAQRCEVKKRIVQNNIYGVDIEKGAIDIARLRFWLSIVVDLEQPTALPNFDFKFMQGNSLLEQWEGLDLSDLLPQNDKTKGLRLIFSEEQVQHEIILNKQEQYFSESDHTKKAILRDQIKEAVKELILARTEGKQALAYRIEDIDISANTHFFLWHTWFADVFSRPSKQGFDIVIGNPPYIDSETMSKAMPNERELYSKVYNCARGNWDMFIVFLELGLKLLSEKGVLSYIIPNKLIAAKYGIELRRVLATNQVVEIRDYSRIDVFTDAAVYPITIVLQKDNSLRNSRFSIMENRVVVKKTNIIESKELKTSDYWDMFFTDSIVIDIIRKINLNKTISEKFPVEVLGAATVADAYEIKQMVCDNASNTNGFKLINSGTIDPYVALWGQKSCKYLKGNYINPSVPCQDLKNYSNVRFLQASSTKIIIASMTTRYEAFFDNIGVYLAGKSTTIITGDSTYLYFLTGIVNSKLASFWLNVTFNSLKMSGGAINIGKNEIQRLPIPNYSPKIEPIVRKIIDAKHNDINYNITKELEQIDRIVYELYGLTEQEIRIVKEY